MQHERWDCRYKLLLIKILNETKPQQKTQMIVSTTQRGVYQKKVREIKLDKLPGENEKFGYQCLRVQSIYKRIKC